MTPCFFFTMESLARIPKTGINQRTGQLFLSQAVAPRCSIAAPAGLPPLSLVHSRPGLVHHLVLAHQDQTRDGEDH